MIDFACSPAVNGLEKISFYQSWAFKFLNALQGIWKRFLVKIGEIETNCFLKFSSGLISLTRNYKRIRFFLIRKEMF